MNSRAPLRLELGHGCYVYGSFGHGGTCNHLDPVFEEEHGMTESQISDFIRSSRPDLFQQLGGLPLPSTYIQGLSVSIPKLSRLPLTNWPTNPRPLTKTWDEAICFDQNIQVLKSPFRAAESVLSMSESQHKRHVQRSVLNGGQLILQKVTDSGGKVVCSRPGCSELNARIPAGGFFLTLTRDFLSTSGTGIIKEEETHYCLECLEEIFDRCLTFLEPDRTSPRSDGADDGLTDFPYYYPSNSSEALNLRKRRHSELEDTLNYEQARKSKSTPQEQEKDSADRSPDLKLTRANDVSPYKERYQKQGLQYSRRSIRISDEVGKDKLSSTSETLAEATTKEDFICVCREPANDKSTITCESEYCMIGTFHTECLGLQHPIVEGSKFYCMYCTEALNPTHANEVEAVSAEEDTATFTGDLYEVPRDGSDMATFSSTSTEVADDDNEESTEVGDWCSEQEWDDDLNLLIKHGFIAINKPNAGTNMSSAAQYDGPHSSVPIAPYLNSIDPSSGKDHFKKHYNVSAVPLPPGSSSMTFTDLAPFITLDSRARSMGWTKEEVTVFAQWKSTCPKSRLLVSLSVNDKAKNGVCTTFANGHDGPCHMISPLRLSEFLRSVRATSIGI